MSSSGTYLCSIAKLAVSPGPSLGLKDEVSADYGCIVHMIPEEDSFRFHKRVRDI